MCNIIFTWPRRFSVVSTVRKKRECSIRTRWKGNSVNGSRSNIVSRSDGGSGIDCRIYCQGFLALCPSGRERNYHYRGTTVVPEAQKKALRLISPAAPPDDVLGRIFSTFCIDKITIFPTGFCRGSCWDSLRSSQPASYFRRYASLREQGQGRQAGFRWKSGGMLENCGRRSHGGGRQVPPAMAVFFPRQTLRGEQTCQ